MSLVSWSAAFLRRLRLRWLFAQKPFDPSNRPKPAQTPTFPENPSLPRNPPGIPTGFILSAIQNPTEFHWVPLTFPKFPEFAQIPLNPWNFRNIKGGEEFTQSASLRSVCVWNLCMASQRTLPYLNRKCFNHVHVQKIHAQYPQDPPVLKIVRSKFTTARKNATAIAKRYGECSEVLVFSLRKERSNRTVRRVQNYGG